MGPLPLLSLVVLSFIGAKVLCVLIPGPAELSVEAGSSLSLTCKGEGVLTWFYHGVLVMEGGVIRLPHSGEVVVDHVTSEHAGVYTCTNGSSSDTVSVSIHSSGDNNLEYDPVLSAAVGGVIGVCVVSVSLILGVCSIVVCVFHKHKERHWDEMEYETKEVYVATLNMEVLKRLSPDLRSQIDFDFLAQLTNTDPSLLEGYKHLPESQLDSKEIELDSEEIQSESKETMFYKSPSCASISTVYVSGIKPIRMTDSAPITPQRRQASFITAPNSPALSLRHHVGTTIETGKEGGRQNLLRMLKLVENSDSVSGH